MTVSLNPDLKRFMAISDTIPFLEIVTGMSSKDLISIIVTIIFAVVIIRIIIYSEINKINKELRKIDNKINWESKRLDEKLKIYERLAKIEEKLRI